MEIFCHPRDTVSKAALQASGAGSRFKGTAARCHRGAAAAAAAPERIAVTLDCVVSAGRQRSAAIAADRSRISVIGGTPVPDARLMAEFGFSIRRALWPLAGGGASPCVSSPRLSPIGNADAAPEAARRVRWRDSGGTELACRRCLPPYVAVDRQWWRRGRPALDSCPLVSLSFGPRQR